MGGLEWGPWRTAAQQSGELNVQVKRDYSSSEDNQSVLRTERDAESIQFLTSHLHQDETEPTEHGKESVTGNHGALSFIDPIDTSDLVPSPTESRYISVGASASEYRTSKPMLLRLLERWDIAFPILSYLDFKATMSLQQLFPSLTTVCQDTIQKLSETHIIVSTTERTGEHEQETNRDMLYPIIARIPPEERFFPENRIVYESKH
jgi:hypothetical protein